MTKSNFDEADQEADVRAPAAARARATAVGYGAIRKKDGRSARRTGRTEQFATVVSPEFKDWMKAQRGEDRQNAGRAARRHEGRVHRKIRRE